MVSRLGRCRTAAGWLRSKARVGGAHAGSTAQREGGWEPPGAVPEPAANGALSGGGPFQCRPSQSRPVELGRAVPRGAMAAVRSNAPLAAPPCSALVQGRVLVVLSG